MGKFTIPEPPQPYCPFAVNQVADIKLDPSCSMLFVDFGEPETPLHPDAMEAQAIRAWGRWDSDNYYAVWPPFTALRYNSMLIVRRWII